MAYHVEVAGTALDEIDEIYLWLRDASPTAAERWYTGLIEVLSSLRLNPLRCPLAPENEAFADEVRQLLYGRRRGTYRVLFTVNDDEVRVLHVRHAARRPLKP